MSSYLYELIAQGEHDQQDFKYCISDSKKIARSLVAFANSKGGRLLIGVKDNGKIAGISSDEEFYMIESAAKIFSKPRIDFSTRQWHLEGKTVLEIGIEPGKQKPYLAKNETGKWLAYIRVNDENVLAHSVQIEAWKKQFSSKGVWFSYSDHERFLIHFLQKNESLTLSKFMRLTRLSRKKASHILSTFLAIDVIKIHTSSEGTYFLLNRNLEHDDLEKITDKYPAPDRQTNKTQ